MKTKFYDWLWWTIGSKIWKRSARSHPASEVERRLSWMRLDCRENDDSWRSSPEGRKWLTNQARLKKISQE